MMSFKSAQKNYSIKVAFKDETRRLQLSEQNFNFSSLKRAIVDLMPSIQNRPFSIQWQDDEVILFYLYDISPKIHIIIINLFIG
jgi:hypothetical protein